jgi:hypothetical protein
MALAISLFDGRVGRRAGAVVVSAAGGSGRRARGAVAWQAAS